MLPLCDRACPAVVVLLNDLRFSVVLWAKYIYTWYNIPCGDEKKRLFFGGCFFLLRALLFTFFFVSDELEGC